MTSNILLNKSLENLKLIVISKAQYEKEKQEGTLSPFNLYFISDTGEHLYIGENEIYGANGPSIVESSNSTSNLKKNIFYNDIIDDYKIGEEKDSDLTKHKQWKSRDFSMF